MMKAIFLNVPYSPKPECATILTTEEIVILIYKNDRIELRNIVNPEKKVSTFPMELCPIPGVDILPYRGANVMVFCDEERILAWNPHRSNMPIAEYSVNEPYGINSMANIAVPEGLLSIVATTSGAIHKLINFQCDKILHPLNNYFFYNVIMLPGGRIFGLCSNAKIKILELTSDGETVLLLDAKNILKIMSDLPIVGSYWSNMLKLEEERLRKMFGNDIEHLIINSLGWPQLKSIVFDGKNVIAFSFGISIGNTRDSVIIFLEPLKNDFAVLGHYYLKGYILEHFTVIPIENGGTRLVGALLSDFKENYDLIVWARATSTNKGIVFVPEGSTLRTYDDMAYVEMIDHQNGYACDCSGGLFSFSIKESSFQEIEREKSRIIFLDIVRL